MTSDFSVGFARVSHNAPVSRAWGGPVNSRVLAMSIEALEAAEPLRAVAYVRMSTDRQIYSTANQIDAIAAYAARKNIAILRTYKDDGKSGLLLDRRPALKSLLGDVMLGKADFDCILVYDISRWGRFQNSDESAHYEFICKEAGVRVEYCAEEFSNDGSLLSNVMKSLKRAMAAEYSRELSTKVFAAQCRLIADSDEVAQAYRYEVARGFRDDVAHLSDLISPSGEAFWPAGSLASVKPRGQSGIATSTFFLLLRLLWACGQRDCVVQAQRHVHGAQVFRADCRVRRRLSPVRSSRWALWTRRSSTASA